jgi:hypothetical protein
MDRLQTKRILQRHSMQGPVTSRQEKEGSEKYEMIRNICKSDCIHTTYEFHHWLMSHKYEIVRKE